ncbi:MAG TPA: mycofactocin-associated electron transfer flavoprotein beta subunit [Mycobacteriales bacterium]|nr:mycofactocin-associated electron transfer flavoprotein beta subunit [Mycobacteriales bacterium]
MLVVALLHPVDLRTAVDPLTGAVTHDPRLAALSAPDEAALEHALRAGDAWGARVLALSAGGPEADGALREARARGADIRRIALPTSHLDDLVRDEQALAREIVVGIGERPDLVLCGDRSTDRGTGALPAFLAHELGMVQAPGLVSLVLEDGALLGERRLDQGRREQMRVPLPAVCSVEAAGVRLRRASLPGSLAAAEIPVEVVAGAVPPARVRVIQARAARPRPRQVPAPTGSARERLLALTGALLSHEPPTVVGPVDAADAVDALLDFLVRHGYLSEARTGWAVQ